MPGGIVLNPSEAIQASVARHVPKLPVERFNAIASMYQVERQHRAEPARAVKDRMERLSRAATALWVEVGTLSEEATDALYAGAHDVGFPNVEALESAIDVIAKAARAAEMSIKPRSGKPRGALDVMVSRLAGVMTGVGLVPDARPTGDLVFLAGSVLEAYGESRGDLVKQIRRVLDKIPPG